MHDQDRRRVIVTRRLTSGAMRALEESGLAVTVMGTDPPSRSQLLQDVRGATAILCMITERIDAEVLDHAGPTLQIVANCAVGYDNIDVAEGQRRGITVTNTPGVLDNATADLAVGLMLTVTRRIAESDRFLREGGTWVWGPGLFVGLDLSAGATLGIIGLGRIGQAVARRALAFGMNVIALESGADVPRELRHAVTRVPLESLLRTSDIVSLHCPLTPDTRHLIGAAALAHMKPEAVLINTARGELVDTEALIEALTANRIAGAGLDVFEGEPLVDKRLLQFPNVVVTPHIGSAGVATRERMCDLVVDNVTAVLSGRPPLTPVVS